MTDVIKKKTWKLTDYTVPLLIRLPPNPPIFLTFNHPSNDMPEFVAIPPGRPLI